MLLNLALYYSSGFRNICLNTLCDDLMCHKLILCNIPLYFDEITQNSPVLNITEYLRKTEALKQACSKDSVLTALFILKAFMTTKSDAIKYRTCNSQSQLTIGFNMGT